MKRTSSRQTSHGFSAIRRTIKTYSEKEKWVSVGLLFLFLFSGWKIMTGNWEGRDLINVVQGGHNYNEGMVGEIIRINPVYADLNEVDRDISSLVFEGLSKYDPIQEKMVENIATHTLDESKTVYTFNLKEGLTWHDGEALTADDVYFTYHDVIQHPEFENPILRDSFSNMTIEKIDEMTVTMTLTETNSFFFTQLNVGILPQHVLGEIPVSELDTNEFNQMPIGNGPYKVSGTYNRQKNGETNVKLTYFDEYRETESPDITKINFYTFPSYEELLEGRGQIHGIARIPNYRLEETAQTRLTEYQYYLPQYTALFIETDNETLINRNIRLAIQKSIDKQKIIEAIGYDHTIDTPLLQLDQEEWIYQPNTEEAMGALYDEGWFLDEETGYRVNEDGDEILSFVLIRRAYPDNEKQEDVTKTTAEMIKEMLGEVGISITIETYEADAFQEKVTTRDYDLILFGQSLGYNLDTYSYWHSSQANDGGLNLSNYGNAKSDFYIEAIRNTFGEAEEERNEYLEDLAENIKDDIPAVFLYTPTYYFLADSRIQNIELGNILFPQDRFANILSWTIE